MGGRERALEPADLINESSIWGDVHIGLKIREVLGKEAEDAWIGYRLHSIPDHSYVERYFDPQVAREYYEKFTEIAGFDPDQLVIEIYAREKGHDFSTIKF